MLKQLPFRIAAPTVLVSVLLLTLSILAAVYLYLRQASTEQVVEENIQSAMIAHELENTLNNVIVLLKGGGEQAESLHDRIREQMQTARDLADKPEEQRLVGELEQVMNRYFSLWTKQRDSGAEPDPAMYAQAQSLLEKQAIPICGQLQAFNAQQIKQSEQANSRSVRWMIFGLIGVGTVGSLVGMVLGYGVARRVGQSIYHLRVHLQDAAQKLGRDLPDISVVTGDDLQHVHDQLQGVVGEIEQMIATLQQRNREVERAEQMSVVGQLAAGVAHELRNPLTSIKMLVQTNREQALARGTEAEDLEIIEQEIRRMEITLQHFLDFARPPRLERRPLDLCQPIERTLALIAGRANRLKVHIRFDKPAQPVTVDADPEQLQQLLLNLTLNALDVMPRGGELAVEIDQQDSGRVEVRVLDTGAGIAADMWPRLFQPFSSNKDTGLGLGLVISRRIAEGHGGTLHAANRKEGGAAFVLSLPHSEAAAPALAG
jgi:signal transduction histidine kinase